MNFSVTLITTVLGSLLLLGSAMAIEPLQSSTQTLLNQQVKRLLTKFDKNKDGKIQKIEDPKLWKRKAHHDQNNDAGLDAGELKSTLTYSMDNPGGELLNVLYKQTPQGGTYLDIYYPDDASNTQKPVVFFTHGGGWAAGNKSKAADRDFQKVHLALLEQGFCVVSVGYRLVRKNSGTAIRDCVIDCKDAMRFISAHKTSLGIDPNKFYVFGDSAGGHLAMMLLLSPPNSFIGDNELAEYDYRTVAGVSWYGPCDFQDIQLFNHDDSPNFIDRFQARIITKETDPAEKEARYREVSPINYLTEKSPPLLMIQGDKDTTIPVKQAYRMQQALETIQAPVDTIIVKNSGHNWRSVGAPISPNTKTIIKATADFLIKHKK